MKPIYLVLVLALWGASSAQEAPPDGSKNSPTDHCSPSRTIQSDGSILVRNADCTTRTIANSASDPKSVQKAGAGQAEPLMPEAPSEMTDPAVRQKYFEALSGYYSYRTTAYEHRHQVFAWQLFSSKIIFVVVILLVCSGIYFAALQFHAGLRLQAERELRQTKMLAAAAGTPISLVETKTEPAEASSVELSPTGIKVSSPILGVIILTLSLAFFYLYLVYVYPITDMF